jgi:hypothetical protein
MATKTVLKKKAEEKKDPWLNYLALCTVILAVCATLAAFKGGGYSTRSVISQAQASDQWAFYQAKSVKQNLYQLQQESMQLDFETMPRDTPKAKKFQTKLADYSQKISRYEAEKKEIFDSAKKLEEQRDEAQRHTQPFGIAVIFLQVAILISTIAGLFKRKEIWYAALPIGLIGIVNFLNGFFLFLPF